MKRIILIHGWEETPEGQWLPWVAEQLRKEGWVVEVPQMPNTKTPKCKEWMAKLESLSPDENTVLVGHSLANALIMKYLEKPATHIKGAVLVAAWDWLMQEIKEFHQSFFEEDFDYEAIKQKNIPLVIMNSTTDPWINFEKSKALETKLNARFIAVEKAGHFMERDGYKTFPQLLKIIQTTYSW